MPELSSPLVGVLAVLVVFLTCRGLARYLIGRLTAGKDWNRHA
jgi:hypothetical protein